MTESHSHWQKPKRVLYDPCFNYSYWHQPAKAQSVIMTQPYWLSECLNLSHRTLPIIHTFWLKKSDNFKLRFLVLATSRKSSEVRKWLLFCSPWEEKATLVWRVDERWPALDVKRCGAWALKGPRRMKASPGKTVKSHKRWGFDHGPSWRWEKIGGFLESSHVLRHWLKLFWGWSWLWFKPHTTIQNLQ